LFDAIRRILKGELGQDILLFQEPSGVCEFLEEEQKGQPRHSISIVHTIQLPDDVVIKLDNNSKEVGFFKELPSPIIPPQKEFLTNQGYK
jgi:ADP-ribose pyrophosphatase YjhB (NUDIX family)